MTDEPAAETTADDIRAWHQRLRHEATLGQPRQVFALGFDVDPAPGAVLEALNQHAAHTAEDDPEPAGQTSDPRITTDADRAIVARVTELDDAFRAASVDAEVWYDEDGDEGWHITITAGPTVYLRGGGTQEAVVLAYWTRDDTWYWSDVTNVSPTHGGEDSTYPAREFPHGATEPTAAIVAAVQDRLVNEVVDPPDRFVPFVPVRSDQPVDGFFRGSPSSALE